MKVRVPIDQLRVGMFIEAEVRTLFLDGEMRHFLEPSEADYAEPTGKRLRLMKRKFEAVANSGGMLLGSVKQIGALQQIGVTAVVVNTDKSDILPEGAEPAPLARPPAPARASTEWVRDLVGQPAEPIPGDEPPARQPGGPRRRLDIAGTERRRNFGPSNAGWMKVEIAETDDDGEPRLCAFLQVISFGGDGRMGADDLFRALDEQFGICAGLDEAMVRKLAQQAAASPNRVIRGQFLVASSPRRDPDKLGRIDYVCLRDLPVGTELTFPRLRQAFAAVEPQDIADPAVRACTVVPGQELAVFDPAGEDEGPPDIFGNRRGAGGASALLRPGAGVELDGDRYLSRTYGYLCLHDGEISVIPPVWVAPDRMRACYVHLADPRPEPPTLTRDWLTQVLRGRAVTWGLQEAAIDELLAVPPEAAAAVLIAEGRRPRRGDDASARYGFAVGAELPADMAERHQRTLVRAGDLVAEVTAATAGEGGMDVSGIEVVGESGVELELTAGMNVRCERDARGQRFYAELQGSARLLERVLKVQPVVYVQGSIDAPFRVKPGSDVYVRGSVRAGGTIEADGSVAVEGSVEGGAVIQSQESVTVAKGIIGHATRVVARGDVSARFVHNASVIAAGDVTATHLMNATVRGRHLRVDDVEGDARSGSIVGGQSLATGSVQASRAGSPTSEQTKIAIVGDPQIQAQMAKLDKGLDFCRTNIVRILRTLGVRQIDAVQLKGLIEKAPAAKRRPLVKILTQLKQLVETRDKSVRLREGLEAEQQGLFAEAEIRIRELVHADVTVRIGDRVLAPKDDIASGAVFRLTRTGIGWGPTEASPAARA